MDPAKAFMAMEVLLNDQDRLADGAPGPMWESIYCSRKVAYGCGKHGRNLVEGLTLYVSRPDHPTVTRSMTIRLSYEAFRSIKAILGVSGSSLQGRGFVKIANQGLLVLHVSFRVLDVNDGEYYLVYDSTDASLYMIPGLPANQDLVPSFTSTPVPRRVGRDPQLVLMARWFWSECNPDALCLCTPATSPSGTTSPWDTRVRRFPYLPPSFIKADVMFSFEGKVFWADLSCGLVYCDLRGGTESSAVQFDFIELPFGYQIVLDDWLEDELTERPEMNRTISCVGGCIKFVCIDRPRGYPGHEMVKVWTLDLGSKEWKADKVLLWRDLWKGVKFMDTKLWETEPRYPILMPDDTLCLMLWDKRPRRNSRLNVDCICRFDMFSKSPLWHGVVHYYHTMCPVTLPCDFFTKCCPPPGPCESKLPARKRKLQSTP